MNCRPPHTLAAAALLLCVSASNIRAEIPISILRDMQDKAPEALMIKVLSVDQQSKRREFEEKNGQKVIEEIIAVTASARVQTVLRSASALAPGNAVTIQYEIKRRTPPVPDASPPAILKVGETVRAYLSKPSGGSSYTPAAVSQSFVTP